MTHDELLNAIKAYDWHGQDWRAWDSIRAIVGLEPDGWDDIKDITYPIGKKDLPEFYYKLGQMEAKAQIVQIIEKEMDCCDSRPITV